MNLFVTGGAGFIGSNFILMALERGHAVLNYDLLTYAGNLRNLEGVKPSDDYRFVEGDITDHTSVVAALKLGFPDGFDAVVNFAAESHVDRSIEAGRVFANTNVLGAATLVECARSAGVPMFVQVSTDEVYGSLGPQDKFSLNSKLKPTSPYAASKASADLMVLSFHHTHGYDVRVTRCTNNYGRFQHPEKFIPTIIARAMKGEMIPVYGDGKYTRDWIFVEDHCEGIFDVLLKGQAGKTYLFGGSSEVENNQLVLDVTRIVAKYSGKDEEELRNLVTYVADRPGHDRRYAIDWSESARELGWKPKHSFESALDRTIAWYYANRDWWEAAESQVKRPEPAQ
jgi:dTDP-glucose 4,6-dehydratase